VTTSEIPIVRLQLRYPDESTFVQRFAPNVTRGGIFLASRAPFPVGSVLGFEVSLMQGPPLLAGSGKVAWVREFNPDEPQRAHGMGVQFIKVSVSCQPLLERMLAYKAQPARHSPPSGIPIQIENSQDSQRAGGSGPYEVSALEGDPSSWIDDQGVRVAADRARALASRVEDVEALRVREREELPSLEQALADLPRLLGPRHQAS